MKRKQHIHFVGIKGVGMAPLTIIAKEARFVVSGCDIADEFITDPILRKANISPLTGFSKDHLAGVTLVVTTGAHDGFDNPEVQAAKNMGIRVIAQGEAVGLFMEGTILGKRRQIGISVAGTHGKTTTTAMIATVLSHTGADPSYVVGTGTIPSLQSSGHFGRGKYFVAEADEYATEPVYDMTPKFLWQHPKIAVFTNIEHDHPDVYLTVDAMRKAFLRFAKQLPEDGVLIACGDDPQLQKLFAEYGKRKVTYGLSPKNDCVIQRVRISASQMFFWLEAYGVSLGEFMVGVTGEHNALNAAACVLVGMELGLSMDSIKKTLREFVGTKRRLEYVGQLSSGATVYDDYAHHPTEIKKTLLALRSMYPKKHIVGIFQPHTFSRTKTLFREFVRAFDQADAVIVNDIYPSLREQPDPTISSRILVAEMNPIHKDVLYLPELSDVVEYLEQKRFRSDSIIVIMGAGDIYKIIEALDLAHE